MSRKKDSDEPFDQPLMVDDSRACYYCDTPLVINKKQDFSLICPKGCGCIGVVILFTVDDLHNFKGSEEEKRVFLQTLESDSFYDYVLENDGYWLWLEAQWDAWRVEHPLVELPIELPVEPPIVEVSDEEFEEFEEKEEEE